jgi:glycosyltransferase involved in cell wall biosynthesis
MNLSICIPTYRRPKFLQFTLNRLIKDFPGSEFIVSDNDLGLTPTWFLCNDGALDWPHIDYSQQKENIGAFPNMYAALSSATRKYAVYCADDDYLKPEQIKVGIDYLEHNPKCVAYCAPCEVWDEVNQAPLWNAYNTREPRSYSLSDGRELFNFLIQSHIWPEHIIYRTPVPIIPRTRAYWAFADLVDILKAGDIFFSNTPFYRNLLVHPVGMRTQLGNVQCLTHFDEYRGGLEVLAHGLFGSDLPYKARHKLQEMISSFICARMHVAATLYAREGHIEEATMLLQRISVANPTHDAVVSPHV